MVCSHDPFFTTDKESSIWRQNDHAKFVGAFHLSRRVSDENRACSISIRFFKITDPFDGRSFLMCSHDPFFVIQFTICFYFISRLKEKTLAGSHLEFLIMMDNIWPYSQFCFS